MLVEVASLAPRALDTAAIILTFRPEPGMLEAAVESVLTESPDLHVIVVDNGDQALGLLGAAELGGRSLAQQVTVLTTGYNGGYAGGMNAGIRLALEHGASTVVLLNDDVEVVSGWIEPLLEELGASPDVGAVQPLLINSTRDRINSAGVELDKFGAGSDARRDQAIEAAGVTPTNIEVFTGGAVALTAAFLGAVGLFDERFFLYYEDVELSRRGRRLGWRYRLVPTAHVAHRGSASTERLGDDVRRLQERNRIWSSAMHGGVREIAAGLSLSLRRLRHEPRRAHRDAAVQGVQAMPGLLARRLRRPGGASRRLIGRVRGTSTQRAASRVAGTPGVNIVGYHHISSGLGAIARELTASLDAAGIPHVAIDNDLSTSPRRRAARPVPSALYDTTIAVVTAFEFANFCERFPQLVGPGKTMIGVWFWELADVPEQHVEAALLLDEIWAPTTFVQDAYRQAVSADTAVRFAPFRVEEPSVDRELVAQWRSEWGDDPVFLVSFDYLSIVERKNPLGAIAAFRSAFGDGSLPVRLIIKSINGDQRPDDVATIRGACGDDDRIQLLDEHLDDAQHHSLLAAADVLISLHRSEGYGLHPAMAMRVGTAVVATRYSGVVDFMDDSVSAMVDAELVEVTNGQGIYPDTAKWADPDIAQAAQYLRRLATDDEYRSDLIERAQRRIGDQPTAAEFGEGYAAMLRASTVGSVGAVDEPFFAGLDAARGKVAALRGRRRLVEASPWPDSARR